MPEREDNARRRQMTLAVARRLSLVFLLYVAYTEFRPMGWALGSVELGCARATSLYAAGVLAYQQEKGRLPHSLDQLVPLYLPEHRPCDGTFTGSEPVTRFGLQQKLRKLIFWSPPAQIPDYNVIQRPDGTHSFQILCSRRHEERHGFRGDFGSFTVAGF